jgi:hypothetical protein
MRYSRSIMIGAMLLAATNATLAFDQSHAGWDALLKRHVVDTQNGGSSRVDYAGFSRDQGALNGYLDGLSAVTETEPSSFQS